MTYSHIAAALRGWYPRWAAVIRSSHGIRWYAAYILAGIVGRKVWRSK